GLLLDRGAGFVAAVLAAWRRGAPFVPLDPRWPAARLEELAAQAGIGHVVTDGGAIPVLAGTRRILAADAAADAAQAPPVVGGTLAYVIFTSGSTGRPKGVRVGHRQLHNYLHALAERLGLEAGGPQPCFATTAGFAADLGYTALFGTLCTGGRLLLVEEALATDPDALAALFRAQPVDYLKTVPSHFAALLSARDAAALLPRRALICGGEALPWALVDRARALSPSTAVFNHYGPTETTVGAVAGRVDALPAHARAGETAPLGQPLANMAVTLLNGAGQPVPAGAPGEIVLSGVQVAEGYLDGTEPGGFRPGAVPAYRTGDLARRLPDGTLLYLGRADRQVKIRGYRVEPEELAAALRRQPGVRDVAVVASPAPAGGQRLLAYVVPAGAEPEGWADTLLAVLRDSLPEFMLPAAVVPLPAMPRLGNGKLDTQRLPQPEPAAHRAAGPRNVVEAALLPAFAAVLRAPCAGVSDNFFDLGGDSILAIQIVARVRQAGWVVTTRQIFTHQTVAELAFVASPADAAATAADTGAPAPPTPIQRRFLQLGLANPAHYNQAMIFAAPPDATPEVLRPALAAVIARHDALRMRLSDYGPAAQLLFGDAEDAGSILRVLDLPGAEAVALEAALAAAQGGLDPVAGPLMRMTLVRRGGGLPPLLHWAIHHLAVDGVSWRILLAELDTACRQLRAGQPVVLPPVTMSFAGWARLLQAHATSAAVAAELPYWIAAGSADGAAPPPADHALAPDTVLQARRVSVALDAAETDALLKRAPAAYNTQVNDLLLAALARAMRAATGQAALRVDLEGHGREPPDEAADLSRSVGWFTSLFPLRLTLPPRGWADDPGADIRAVKEALRRVPGRGIGYGLLRYGAGAAALQAQPAAPMVFNYLGQFDSLSDGGADTLLAGEAGTGAGPMRDPRQHRVYPIEVNALVLAGRLRLSLDYPAGRYAAATAQGWAEAIMAELRLLLEHCLADGTGGHTASDFEMAGMDDADLARLATLMGKDH
ncbi:condensation domain-containing protein, partial [Teichococcus wenyumeiae]